MESLNDTEFMLFNQLLDRYEEMLGNAGCNDYEIPTTPEGIKLIQEVREHEEPGCGYTPNKNEENDLVNDFSLLSVLRQKIGLTTPT